MVPWLRQGLSCAALVGPCLNASADAHLSLVYMAIWWRTLVRMMHHQASLLRSAACCSLAVAPPTPTP